MKELPRVPGTRIQCPEECRYRNKLAPFCGYCLPLVKKKLGLDANGKEKQYGGEEKNNNYRS